MLLLNTAAAHIEVQAHSPAMGSPRNASKTSRIDLPASLRNFSEHAMPPYEVSVPEERRAEEALGMLKAVAMSVHPVPLKLSKMRISHVLQGAVSSWWI